MVSPEGTGTQPDRPKSGRGILLAVATLVIAAGFAVLGSLSPAEELAVETTTTAPTTTTTVIEAPIDLDNFDVGQIVTGVPLALMKAAEIEEGYPLALVEHEGNHFLFVATSSQWLPSEGGLLAWHSVDGADWNPLGMVIADQFHVTRVIAANGLLIAAGASIDDGSLVLWESEDGVDWSATEVDRGPNTPHTRTIPTALGSDGETTVIATTTDADMQGLVERALDDAGVSVDVARRGWGVETDQEGRWVLTIYGPFGIGARQIALADLNLSDEERQVLEGRYDSNSESVLWVHHPSSGWTQTAIEGMHGVETLVSRPSGGLVARGWGNTGMVTATSEDGRNWTRLDTSDGGPWYAELWGETLVGPDDMSVPEILTSTDGAVWETAGLATHFPVGINWSTWPTAAGPGGVALVASGSSAGPRTETLEPVEWLTDKGHSIAFDPMSGRLEVEVGDMSHTWNVYSGTQTNDLLLNLEEETIEFLDTDSGVSFGRITFAEIEEAEEDFYGNRFRGDEHRALVFTPDGENWSIQDITDSIGPEAVITNLMVGSDRLVAVVLPEGEWYDPDEAPRFEIWTAPLP